MIEGYDRKAEVNFAWLEFTLERICYEIRNLTILLLTQLRSRGEYLDSPPVMSQVYTTSIRQAQSSRDRLLIP